MVSYLSQMLCFCFSSQLDILIKKQPKTMWIIIVIDNRIAAIFNTYLFSFYTGHPYRIFTKDTNFSTRLAFDLFIETYSSMLSFQWCLAWCSPGSNTTLVLQNLVVVSYVFLRLIWFLCLFVLVYFWLVRWFLCFVFFNKSMF